MQISVMPLIDDLISNKKLSEDGASVLMTEHQISGKSVEALVLEMGILDEDSLLTRLACLRQCPAIDPTNHLESIRLLYPMLPREIWHKCQALPISYNEHLSTLTVAMVDVGDIQAQDLLLRYLANHIVLEPVLSKKSQILTILESLTPPSDVTSTDQCVVDDKIINRFLQQMITNAVQEKASDIHFQPEKFMIRVRYRLDGLLHTVHCFHTSFWQPLCIQLKILATMDISENRRPQDGRFSLTIAGRAIDFRASSHPTIYGENLVLRILDQQQSLIALEHLGYSQHNLQAISRIVAKPEGLIVLTGPTGSGKTTSLYSMLATLDHEQNNIMTLEDPVEYHMPYIRQSEVKEKTSFDFLSGMQSMLRQDPDVILIGEVRDEKTANMAIRAGMTGHKVFTTLHTVNALGALYRFIELNVPVSLLAGVLNGIVAQRLIRLLCQTCKTTLTLSSQEAVQYRLWPQVNIFKPVGCPECHFSGYKGRKAIAEVIVMDSDIETMILERASYQDFQRILAHKSFRNISNDAIDSLLQGETSLTEIQRVIGAL
jgi:type II secretory ATPase GspE/PulE/Tfp pilus assembly ATPase PilB-like protein